MRGMEGFACGDARRCLEEPSCTRRRGGGKLREKCEVTFLSRLVCTLRLLCCFEAALQRTRAALLQLLLPFLPLRACMCALDGFGVRSQD